MTTTEITVFGTAVLGPILAYLKVREDRLKTADKRDTELRALEDRLDMQQKQIADMQQKLMGIDEMKDSIHKIDVTLATIKTLLEVYMKKIDSAEAQTAVSCALRPSRVGALHNSGE